MLHNKRGLKCRLCQQTLPLREVNSRTIPHSSKTIRHTYGVCKASQDPFWGMWGGGIFKKKIFLQIKYKKKNVLATPKMMSYQLLIPGQIQCDRKHDTQYKCDPMNLLLFFPQYGVLRDTRWKEHNWTICLNSIAFSNDIMP